MKKSMIDASKTLSSIRQGYLTPEQEEAIYRQQQYDYVAWSRAYPDLWFDLITPKTGGISLDADQRVFLRVLARFNSVYGAFPRSWGKCVSEDTLVQTETGFREIGEIFSNITPNTEIYTGHRVKLINKHGKLEQSQAGVASGYQPTIKLTTRRGYQVEGTENHPLLVMNEQGDLEFKELKDIKKGDYVALHNGAQFYGANKSLVEFNDNQKTIPELVRCGNKNSIKHYIRSLLDKQAVWEGHYLKINTPSEKFAKQLQVLLLNMGIPTVRLITEGNTHRIVFERYSLSLLMEIVGMNDSALKITIMKFLESRLLLSTFGIPHQKHRIKRLLELAGEDSKYIKNVVNEDSESHTPLLFQHLLERKDIARNEDYAQIKAHFYSEHLFEKVVSLEASHNYVFDLSMPETQSFLTNSFISHNTFLEFMYLIHTAVHYPRVTLSMVAQNKQKAAQLLRSKWDEVRQFYPHVLNEVEALPRAAGDDFLLRFKNGALIRNDDNSQTIKGERRHRLMIEEANLLNNALFEDALKPVVDAPRRILGKNAGVDPAERNHQIHFFTTTGFRGTHEYERNVTMLRQMRDMENGIFIFGATYKLTLQMNRGRPASYYEDQRKVSPIHFDMNYNCYWVGSVDSALVSLQEVIELQTLQEAETVGKKGAEYVLCIDVARSESSTNNHTVIGVLKVIRSGNGRVLNIALVNMFTLPNGLTYPQQALEIRKIEQAFNSDVVVIDMNTFGRGLIDPLVHDIIDKETGEVFPSWNTYNTDVTPERQNSPKKIFGFSAQANTSESIMEFIRVVSSKQLQLLVPKNESDLPEHLALDQEGKESERVAYLMPHRETEEFIAELSNLQLEITDTKRSYRVKQITRKIRNDRYSAVSIGIWYIMTQSNKVDRHGINTPEDFGYVSSARGYQRRPNRQSKITTGSANPTGWALRGSRDRSRNTKSRRRGGGF